MERDRDRERQTERKTETKAEKETEIKRQRQKETERQREGSRPQTEMDALQRERDAGGRRESGLVTLAESRRAQRLARCYPRGFSRPPSRVGSRCPRASACPLPPPSLGPGSTASRRSVSFGRSPPRSRGPGCPRGIPTREVSSARSLKGTQRNSCHHFKGPRRAARGQDPAPGNHCSRLDHHVALKVCNRGTRAPPPQPPGQWQVVSGSFSQRT